MRTRNSLLLSLLGASALLAVACEPTSKLGQRRLPANLDSTTFLDEVTSVKSECFNCSNGFHGAISWLYLGPGETDFRIATTVPPALVGKGTLPVAEVDAGGTVTDSGAGLFKLTADSSAMLGVRPPCWNNRSAFGSVDDKGCLDRPGRLDLDRVYPGCQSHALYSVMFPSAVISVSARVSAPELSSNLLAPRRTIYGCVDSCAAGKPCVAEQTFYWVSAKRQAPAGLPASTTGACTVEVGLAGDTFGGVLQGSTCNVPFRAFGATAAITGDVYKAHDAVATAAYTWTTLDAVLNQPVTAQPSQLVVVGVAGRAKDLGTRQYVCRSTGASPQVGVLLSSSWKCFVGDGATGLDRAAFEVLTIGAGQ